LPTFVNSRFYIDLSKYPKVDVASGVMIDQGALLSGFQNMTAVEKSSPADVAGLKVGDIITYVEDEMVNGKKTLTQIIQDYDPGARLKLTVSRAGKDIPLEVELGKVF